MTRCIVTIYESHLVCVFFFFQAEDGIRDLVRSRGLGDVYKRQDFDIVSKLDPKNIISYYYRSKLKSELRDYTGALEDLDKTIDLLPDYTCLLYTSDAADERSSVDLGGRRIIKKKNKEKQE